MASMGKALKDTKVKIPGAVGPLGKGAPVTKAVGQGGLLNVLRKKPIHPNTQVTGFKSLLKKGIASGKVSSPLSGVKS